MTDPMKTPARQAGQTSAVSATNRRPARTANSPKLFVASMSSRTLSGVAVHPELFTTPGYPLPCTRGRVPGRATMPGVHGTAMDRGLSRR